MKITANSLKQGNIIEYKTRLWSIEKQPVHTMPGKGGAFIQVEMKDVLSGTKLNERFRSTEDIEKVRLEAQEYQYLYLEDDFVVLMHLETFEQIRIEKSVFGENLNFLKDDMIVTVESYQEKPLSVALPEHLVLEIVETEPVIKGQTATASFKPAILENGVRIMVPPFIEVNTKVVVRVSDVTYIERYKK
jgi:elongation factor P